MYSIEIRPLKTWEETADVEILQRSVWDDPAWIIHRNMMISLMRNGGLLLGAFDNDDQGRLVGFCLGYLGTESPDAARPAMANLKLVSQRMAVLPEYRDRGVGYELKLAQRQFALKQGIRLITWTFDPLGSRNAHLNIRKLNAIAREYHRDYFGTEPSPQVILGSSDRLLAEWWVTSNRVEQRISGKRGGLGITHYTDAQAVVLNPSRVGTNGLVKPCDLLYQPQSMVSLIEIPENYGEIVKADPGLGQAWRQHSRELLEQTFKGGYTITDFLHGTYEGRTRSFYAVSVAEVVSSSGFSSN
jgi:predicted GNAT superfamily acetyltransferase